MEKYQFSMKGATVEYNQEQQSAKVTNEEGEIVISFSEIEAIASDIKIKYKKFEDQFNSIADFAAWCEIGTVADLTAAIEKEDMGIYSKFAQEVLYLRIQQEAA